MIKPIYKTYDKTKNKLRNNFEDVKYLISLHLQLLEKINKLSHDIDQLWNAVSKFNITIE